MLQSFVLFQQLFSFGAKSDILHSVAIEHLVCTSIVVIFICCGCRHQAAAERAVEMPGCKAGEPPGHAVGAAGLLQAAGRGGERVLQGPRPSG